MGRAAGLTLALALIASNAAADEWQVFSEASGIDGRRTVVASLLSDNLIPNSIGVPSRAILKVQCSQGRLQGYVLWPNLVGVRSVRGAYRIDDQPPVTREGFGSSPDGTATFFYKGTAAKTIDTLRSAKKLVVRAEPGDFAPQEATFTLGSASGPIGEAVAACR